MPFIPSESNDNCQQKKCIDVNKFEEYAFHILFDKNERRWRSCSDLVIYAGLTGSGSRNVIWILLLC